MANKIASAKVRYKRLAISQSSWQIANMQLRLKKLRKERGWTAEVLAAKAGTSKSYISEIETGKKFPSGRLLKRFAEELGVSVYDLIDNDDLADEIRAHMEIMKDLSVEDRRAVSRHAAGLLEQASEPSE
ncbi:helix-turn-helix domain-containing protein [Pseudosulfitobacter pseudonitzschiae]|uniref:helix-turn-helix domain-containing protein n=2 Tax=Pseudosulfitobacter pseudonitzschiae TaxID=1402135 RepID=UPI001CCF912D|nr:helix-turn-helix transcriptional regulator [Pseudosulfitobacter pseudonitzschiae]MCA0133966.1 helix-turn-helix transcriptional regulator [Pseudosulfitobacter pseudonitzschiae]MCD2326404.1 helix-turn-helix transcriptional regulator [Pseudosulfitobacter pseudonitzschiae]MCD2349975.1 helix-turn-helix transcriptional regulator [Pseudosulfitobacter pseudonitzschiae]MCI2216410.1 helix-turn-helix transcriptional regulator [Pseudosulfitobacter pseudonitzschiae]UFE28403.1 helix-turn-helix transcript